MQTVRPWLIVAVFSLALADHDQDSTVEPVKSEAPLGSPRRCFAELGDRALRIDVLPGRGWDNLRNVEQSPVLAYNYSKCQTTYDGTYLVPDHMSSIPVLQSKVDTYAQVFDQSSSYRSVTSASVNSDITVYSFVSGYFSAEHESFKQRVSTQNSVQSRVELRHRRYEVRSNPSATLTTAFRHRILQIAASIQGNLTQTATYLSQLLVRDYGTHYIHTTHVGAVLTKKDYLSREGVKNIVGGSVGISAGAQADFFGKVQLGFNVSFNHEESQSDSYQNAIQSSGIETYGGPLFTTNLTVKEWEAGVESAMVAIDRDGDPIHFLINPDTLPDVPPSIVVSVSLYVKEAVDKYYSVNTHRGCTDFSSPNFDYFANIDDGSCTESSENVTFGGVYQTCRITQGENVCSKLEQRNPLTQDFSCPSGFQAIRLVTGRETYTMSRPQCSTTYKACGFLWLSRCTSGTNCQTRTVTSVAVFETFWCSAIPEESQGVKYYFGGIYTTSTPNPLTRTHGCPTSFTSLKFTSKGYLCVSGDDEIGRSRSLPFGGFHSCSAGNPFAKHEGQQVYPKECPKGFSQHLALVDDDCEVKYCLRSGALSGLLQTPIMLPPFVDLPDSFLNETNSFYILDAHGNLWTNFDRSESWNIISPQSPEYSAALAQVNNSALVNSPGQVESSGASNPLDNPLHAALLGAGAGIVFVAVVFFLVCLAVWCVRCCMKRRRARKQREFILSNDSEMYAQSEAQGGVRETCYVRLEGDVPKDSGSEIRRR